jgi:putative hemolysin
MATPTLFTDTLRRFTPASMPAPVAGALGRILHLHQLDAMYASLAAQPDPAGFAERVLRRFEVEVDVSERDLARVPREGPVLVAANHPFGLIEGLAALAILERVRPDVRILANSLLGAAPELRERIIPIDPFGDGDARRTNPRGLREAWAWLAAGGLLVVFPAGEVAHLDLRRIGIEDPRWHPTAARLLQKTGAKAVPLYFSGKNSALFQMAGLVHHRLRTALLPHELWNKRGARVEARIGHPLAARSLGADPAVITTSLRRRVYWLGRRTPRAAHSRPARVLAPIAPPAPSDWITTEIEALPPARLLAAQGPWQVWQVRQAEAPMTVREIGRLREITFRAAGEGAGASLDLDDFDWHYTHLVLWNREQQRVGGAYRLSPSDRPGRRLYTRTLFRFRRTFWDTLGPALELGRSFICEQDQRSFQPLYLLWRAIGEYIARNPRYVTLFGPVSISSDYQPASRALLAGWLRRHAWDPALARSVRPRRPFFAPKERLGLPEVREMDELDGLVRDLEADGKGVPVLVRQYLRMGGRIASLHVDQSFNGSLDALVITDLRRADRRALAKFFGVERLNAILRTGG